MDNNIQQAVLP